LPADQVIRPSSEIENGVEQRRDLFPQHGLINLNHFTGREPGAGPHTPGKEDHSQAGKQEENDEELHHSG
jgi:hypothetical protein